VSERRQRRRARRRARAEAEFQQRERQRDLALPQLNSLYGHYLLLDVMHRLMERSPTAARVGVVVGGAAFLATIIWLLLGLFGG
jgi:hypothetical protein